MAHDAHKRSQAPPSAAPAPRSAKAFAAVKEHSASHTPASTSSDTTQAQLPLTTRVRVLARRVAGGVRRAVVSRWRRWVRVGTPQAKMVQRAEQWAGSVGGRVQVCICMCACIVVRSCDFACVCVFAVMSSGRCIR